MHEPFVHELMTRQLDVFGYPETTKKGTFSFSSQVINKQLVQDLTIHPHPMVVLAQHSAITMNCNSLKKSETNRFLIGLGEVGVG